MSIKSELTKTASYLQSARKAILGRGGEISLTAGLKDLPEAIYKIPADASLAYQVDDSVAYRKIVPSGAEEFAQVARVGGMTYKCNNLIPFPYNPHIISNGITFTDNGDGSITINGQNNGTNPSVFYIHKVQAPITIKAGTYFNSGNISLTLFDNVNNKYYSFGLNKATTIEADITGGLYIQVSKSDTTVYENFVIYPMLNEGSTALPYEPYFEGLRDTAVTELKSEGANLIPFPTQGFTTNGITFSVQEDGSIIANGTATSNATYELIKNGKAGNIKVKKGETYAFSGCPSGGSSTTYTMSLQDITYVQEYTDTGSGMAKAAVYEDYYVYIRIYAGYTANNLIFKPMLNRGSTAKPYSPFGTIDTYEIPEAVRALDGYGRGIEGYPNYIDYDRKVFVQNTYRKVFDGTENWTARSTTISDKIRLSLGLDVEGVFISLADTAPFICNHYQEGTGSDTWNNKTCGCFNGAKEVVFYDENYQTVAEWKAHLAELYANGNPLIVEYALAKPIEHNISEHLGNDSFIEVEGGGSIKAVNEYEYDAPSTINYIYETAGE